MQMRILFILTLFLPFTLGAQFIYGDQLPDAPELSARGEHAVGVRTMTLTNSDQPNIIGAKEGKIPNYDRPLTVEVWYPADADAKATTEYPEVMGQHGDTTRPIIPFKFTGRATRGAAPKKGETAYPLVVVSHGYTGSRYLMTYLTENLASKGYVVVAIAHTESTFSDAGAFSSTLYFRPIDIRFTIDEMERLNRPDSDSFLAGLADANNTGIVGYSMGGYGVLNVGGAGYNPGFGAFFAAQNSGSKLIERHLIGDETYPGADPRVKAIVALAPWGKTAQVWNDEGLKGLSVPTFFIAGDQDDISGYENGIKAIYEGATNTERYLLTYEGARHNVAPNPAPPEALAPGLPIDEYLRYADSVWDTRRINNVNQHFISAFLGGKLKGETKLGKYLDLTETPGKEGWEGFKPRTAVGLSLGTPSE
ncbi:MAG: putative dienelactone hydrolase [Neolewinella sp.]|jgi:predicted dienelactone hydrolase